MGDFLEFQATSKIWKTAQNCGRDLQRIDTFNFLVKERDDIILCRSWVFMLCRKLQYPASDTIAFLSCEALTAVLRCGVSDYHALSANIPETKDWLQVLAACCVHIMALNESSQNLTRYSDYLAMMNLESNIREKNLHEVEKLVFATLLSHRVNFLAFTPWDMFQELRARLRINLEWHKKLDNFSCVVKEENHCKSSALEDKPAPEVEESVCKIVFAIAYTENFYDTATLLLATLLFLLRSLSAASLDAIKDTESRLRSSLRDVSINPQNVNKLIATLKASLISAVQTDATLQHAFHGRYSTNSELRTGWAALKNALK